MCFRFCFNVSDKRSKLAEHVTGVMSASLSPFCCHSRKPQAGKFHSAGATSRVESFLGFFIALTAATVNSTDKCGDVGLILMAQYNINLNNDLFP